MMDLSTSCPTDSRPLQNECATSSSRHNPFMTDVIPPHGHHQAIAHKNVQGDGKMNTSHSLSMVDSFMELSYPTLQRVNSSSTLDSQLVEDHFSDYFPNIGAGSSIQDLETAVSELKLLVLSECEDSPCRGKMIDRLVELRKELHLAKELQKLKASQRSRASVSSMEQIGESSSPSTNSVHVLKGSGSPSSLTGQSPSASSNNLAESAITAAGHEMVASSNLRLWLFSNRGFCEHCGGLLLTPGRWYFYSCLHCPVMLHPNKECRDGLQRACPIAELNADPLSGSIIAELRMVDSPPAVLSGKGKGRPRVRHRVNIRSHQGHLLDLESVHIAASLGEQNFQCAACHKAIGLPDTNQTTCAFEAAVNQRVAETLYQSNLKTATGRLSAAVTSSVPGAANYLLQHLSSSKDQPPPASRLCHYTHKYYCPECHWGDRHQLPAHILLLGDYHPYGVSRHAYIRLSALWKVALFRAPDAWLLHQRKAWDVFIMRQQLYRLMAFMKDCSDLKGLKKQLEERYGHYLLEQPFTFSMRDVVAVMERRLQPVLNLCLDTFTKHVQSCSSCLSQCHSCRVCDTEELLQPQSETVTLCHGCEHIVHQTCSSPYDKCRFQTICNLCASSSNCD